MTVVVAALAVVALILLWSAWRNRHRPSPGRPVPSAVTRRRRPPNRNQPHHGYHYLARPPLPRGRRYIGIGVDPRARDRDHSRKWWYSSAHPQVVVETLPDWWAAREWEREQVLQAYYAGEPIVNVEYVPGARRRQRRIRT